MQLRRASLLAVRSTMTEAYQSQPRDFYPSRTRPEASETSFAQAKGVLGAREWASGCEALGLEPELNVEFTPFRRRSDWISSFGTLQ